jgi:hypothetical protein
LQNTVIEFSLGDVMTYKIKLTQPMSDGQALDMTVRYTVPIGAEASPIVLDGTPFGLSSSEESAYFTHDVIFEPCHPTEYRLIRRTVTFEGGSMTLLFRMGFSAVSTEPGAFVSASGVLDGVSSKLITGGWSTIPNTITIPATTLFSLMRPSAARADSS